MFARFVRALSGFRAHEFPCEIRLKKNPAHLSLTEGCIPVEYATGYTGLGTPIIVKLAYLMLSRALHDLDGVKAVKTAIFGRSFQVNFQNDRLMDKVLTGAVFLEFL